MKHHVQVIVDGELMLEGYGEIEDRGEGEIEYIVDSGNHQYIVQVADRDPDFLPGEDMDGDHASALASIGWGTDEDYGCFSDDGSDHL